MTNIIRTNSGNKDFVDLVKLLDAELAIRDGEDHSFYAQYNKIVNIKYVVIAYIDNKPAACGAIKEYDKDTIEIKRMFTLQNYRGKGIAMKVLAELEKWADELSFNRCILETGKKQPEAIKLYNKSGYKLIENYGQYAEAENSICFEKIINKR